MDRMWIIVGAGGFIGSAARYLVLGPLARWSGATFPWGLLGVNVLGSLLIGVLFGLGQRYDWLTAEWRLFLGAGVCGGFTTFSAFSLETLQLLQRGDHLNALLFAIGSVVLCLLATAAGLYFTQHLTA